MSPPGDNGENGNERAALQGLEAAVGKLLERVRDLDKRVDKSEARRLEVEDLLKRITTGDASPAEMHGRLRDLETENEELRRRLNDGRETVESLLAKIRFLEEQQ